MTTFYYQGRDTNGRKTSGLQEAASEDLAAEILLNKGIVPTSITVREAKRASNVNWQAWLTPAVPLEVLVMFCRQMYSLTKAGVPLLRSMHGLTQHCHNKQLKLALESVCH
ncbi:MAG: type II secretion system F family protein, partial [Vibrio sp.]